MGLQGDWVQLGGVGSPGCGWTPGCRLDHSQLHRSLHSEHHVPFLCSLFDSALEEVQVTSGGEEGKEQSSQHVDTGFREPWIFY